MSMTSPPDTSPRSRAGKIGGVTSSAARTCSGAHVRAIALIVGRQAAGFSCRARRCIRWRPRPEMIAAVTGREPLLTLDGLRMSRQRMFFSSAKASVSSLSCPALCRGLRDAVDWFRGQVICDDGAAHRFGCCLVWVYLLAARGGFWRAAQRDDARPTTSAENVPGRA